MFQYLPRRVNGSLHRISDFVLKKQAPSDRTGLIQMEGFSMSVPNFALCLEAFMPAAKLYALIICIVPSLCLEYTDRGQVPSPKTLQSDICQKEITGQSDPLQVPTVFLAVSVVDLQIIRQAPFTPPLPADCRKAFDSLIGRGVGGACNLFATRWCWGIHRLAPLEDADNKPRNLVLSVLIGQVARHDLPQAYCASLGWVGAWVGVCASLLLLLWETFILRLLNSEGSDVEWNQRSTCLPAMVK